MVVSVVVSVVVWSGGMGMVAMGGGVGVSGGMGIVVWVHRCGVIGVVV